jgi:CMP-N-acetylneuraminic acid synthetase
LNKSNRISKPPVRIQTESVGQMLDGTFVIGFVIDDGVENLSTEIEALSSSSFIDAVVVTTKNPSIIDEANEQEASSFIYSTADAIDAASTAALNAYFASDETFITGGSDPWLVVVEGSQPMLNGLHVNEAITTLAENSKYNSMHYVLHNAQVSIASHEEFMKTGLLVTDNSLVFLASPD